MILTNGLIMTANTIGADAAPAAPDANPYIRLMTSDNDQCRSAIDGSLIPRLLLAIDKEVRELLGDGPKPRVSLDLEQIQVADYGAFDGITDEQRNLIARLHSEDPIRPEEMTYLALRSLFQFAWPLPESENEIRQACAYDFLLGRYLASEALSAASQLSQPGALLPYWGRMAFLRVMAEIPAENITRFGLERVTVTLMKRAKFNATTFAFAAGPVIGLNYGLQPILKQLNRYVLHFHSTREMAGAKRLSRAWEGMLPMVRYLWSNGTPVTELTRGTTTLYGQENALMAHELTTLQVDFILMHELGHVALDHPAQLQALRQPGVDMTAVRHEYEFAADTFAVGLLRSRLLRRLRSEHEPSLHPQAASVALAKILESHLDHQREIGAVSLLFLYMDFIQRAGDFLRNRLGERSGLHSKIDSHPRPASRLQRLELMNLGDHAHTSQLRRYAETLFNDVLDYAAALDDTALLAGDQPS